MAKKNEAVKPFDQAEYVAGYLKEKYEKMTLAAPKGKISEFKAVCEVRGTKATSELRRFMTGYVEEYKIRGDNNE